MKNRILYLVCFVLAFFLRIIVINQSKGATEDIDLKIYRDAGQLVVNRINPYDNTDNVPLRNKLRLDKDNFHEWLSVDQDRWDSFANSNLPLATLFFGAIEYVFGAPKPYRLIFAFFDSILAVLVLAFVLNKWNFNSSDNFLNKWSGNFKKYVPLTIGLLLGLFCPIILLWGTRIPEHKGIGLLLILSAIYFSDSQKKVNSMFLSPLLLGSSVSFIGLGVFISPICLFNIYRNHNLKAFFVYGVIAFISCVAWLLPFMPELLTMMSRRTVITAPQFGSLWLPVYNVAPEYWMIIRNTFSGLFIVVNFIGFFRNRINIVVISANLLFLFTCIHLTAGSMDRMNIALLSLIILLGYARFINISVLLTALYFIYGVFAYFYTSKVELRQDFDGYFMLVFTAIYFIFLIIQALASQQVKSEVKYSNTGI